MVDRSSPVQPGDPRRYLSARKVAQRSFVEFLHNVKEKTGLKKMWTKNMNMYTHTHTRVRFSRRVRVANEFKVQFYDEHNNGTVHKAKNT